VITLSGFYRETVALTCKKKVKYYRNKDTLKRHAQTFCVSFRVKYRQDVISSEVKVHNRKEGKYSQCNIVWLNMEWALLQWKNESKQIKAFSFDKFLLEWSLSYGKQFKITSVEISFWNMRCNANNSKWEIFYVQFHIFSIVKEKLLWIYKKRKRDEI